MSYSTVYGGATCLVPDTSYYGLDNRLTVGGKMTLDTGPCPARSTTYVYDFAGQRVASQDTVQGEATPAGRAVETYTAAGQLFFSLTPLPSGSANNYAVGWTWYDAGGLRAISKNGSSTTNYPVPDTTLAGEYTAYVFDGGQPVMLLQRGSPLGTWSVTSRMLVVGADRPLAGLYNGQTLAVVADRSGTVVAGIQPSGSADQLATYVSHGPFGNVENPTGGSINTGGDVQAGFAGAGGTPNGLGLVYLRNRWYDPQTGRFLTQDPIGLAGGLNLYAYAGNNPTSFSDPFGLCPRADGTDDGKPCSITLTVQRQSATSHSTEGTFTLSSSSPGAGTVTGATLEPPASPDMSPGGSDGRVRINAGTYGAVASPGVNTYAALQLIGGDPNGKNDIMVHSGNFPKNTHGCILVGASASGPDALTGGTSAPTIRAIRNYIAGVTASDHGRQPNISVVVTNPPNWTP